MYHDQALIPIKTLAFDHAVNVTLGLPFVRTSPDHGTAFDIAGTGKRRSGKPDRRAAFGETARRDGERRTPAGIVTCRARQPAAAAGRDPPARTHRKEIARTEFLVRSQSRRAHCPRCGAACRRHGVRGRPGSRRADACAVGARRATRHCRRARRPRDRCLGGNRRALSGPARYCCRRCAAASTLRPRSVQAPARIVANLPYNIATALLVSWLSIEPWPPWYECAVLMFQREVAERIVAAPGSKGLRAAVGPCAVALRSAHHVRRECRRPSCRRRKSRPRSCASCRALTPLPCDRTVLEKVTQAAFGQRRKMLRQSLRSLGTDTAALSRSGRHRANGAGRRNSRVRIRGAGTGSRRGAGLEHDPEKWKPVFGKDHAQTKKQTLIPFN